MAYWSQQTFSNLVAQTSAAVGLKTALLAYNYSSNNYGPSAYTQTLLYSTTNSLEVGAVYLAFYNINFDFSVSNEKYVIHFVKDNTTLANHTSDPDSYTSGTRREQIKNYVHRFQASSTSASFAIMLSNTSSNTGVFRAFRRTIWVVKI